MTTLALQHEGMDVPQFVFLNNNFKNNTMRDPTHLQKTAKKTRNSATHANHEKYFNVGQNLYNHQHRAVVQAPSHQKSDRKTLIKPTHFHTLERCETQHHFAKLAQGTGLNNVLDRQNKLYYASTASSESDDGASNKNPEFVGFKIVHSGKVLHDETEDELLNFYITEDFGEGKGRYASSTLVTGPNCQIISLPTFL
jgi:hypothetical protein